MVLSVFYHIVMDHLRNICPLAKNHLQNYSKKIYLIRAFMTNGAPDISKQEVFIF